MKKLLSVVAVVGILGLATLGYAHGPSRFGQGWRTQAGALGAHYGPRSSWTRGHFGRMGAGPRDHFRRGGGWMMGRQFGPGPHGCPANGTWTPTQGTTAN